MKPASADASSAAIERSLGECFRFCVGYPASKKLIHGRRRLFERCRDGIEPAGLGIEARSAGKIVSIFEPSTEVIRKGKASKPTEFGKLVKLQEAESQIVIDYEVYAQRPNDSDLLIPAVEIHAAMLGRPPHLLAADAASTPRKMTSRHTPEASNVFAFRTVQPRAPTEARAEKTLVPQRPAMAHGV